MQRNARKKQDLVEQFGGGCKTCGYSQSLRALHFHHINGRPETSTEHILKEVAEYPERFQLLCSNCHLEEHERLDAARAILHSCDWCGKEIDLRRKSKTTRGQYFCSIPCRRSGLTKRSFTEQFDRFRKYLREDGDCWIWEGHWNTDGSARFTVWIDGQHTPKLVHAVAYLMVHGHLPSTYRLRESTCGNRRCVNPAHAYPQEIVGAA